MTADPDSHTDHAARIDDLVVRFLERTETSSEAPSAVLGALCRDHPECAAELRESVGRLGGLGLVGSAMGSEAQRMGPYRLGRRLGGGGMGVVHLAWRDGENRHPVALKVLRADLMGEPGFRERFAREIEAVSRLDHPNIVRVVDRRASDTAAQPTEPETPYVALEYHRGGTLDAIVRHGAKHGASGFGGADALRALGIEADPLALPTPLRGDWWKVAVRITREIARALSHAHSRGVLHRDVKPSNVLLTPEGRALLFDFGLAALPGVGRLTATGAQLGSLPYMPPEALRGSTELDERSDVYSLGVTAHELLTFRLPYSAKDRERLGLAIERGGAPPPSRLMPDVPSRHREALDTVISRAIEVDPQDRYASADAFAADLTQLLRGEAISARPVSQLTRTVRWVRRRPFVAATAGLTAVLALGAPVLFGVLQRSHALAMEGTLEVAADQLAGLVTAVEGVLGSLPEGALDGSEVQARARLESVETSLGAIQSARSNEALLAELDPERAARLSSRLVRCRRKLLVAEADALGVLRQHQEAIDVLEVLLESCTEDLLEDPADLHARFCVGAAAARQGHQHVMIEAWPEAIERARAGLREMETAISLGYHEPGQESLRAAAFLVVARAAAYLGESDVERQACEAAVELLEARDPAPRDRFDLRRLGNARLRLGVLAGRDGDRRYVAESFAAARRALEAAVAARPADALARGLLAETETIDALAAIQASDIDRARQRVARARAQLDVLNELRDDSLTRGWVEAEVERIERYVEAASGSKDSALAGQRTAVAEARTRWNAEPNDAMLTTRLVQGLVNLANALVNNEALPPTRYQEAISLVNETLEVLSVKGDRMSAENRHTAKFNASYNRAVARARLDDVDGARTDVDALAEEALPERPFELRYLVDARAELVLAIERTGGSTAEDVTRLLEAVAAAVQAGYADRAELRSHPTLSGLADDPRFREIVGSGDG